MKGPVGGEIAILLGWRWRGKTDFHVFLWISSRCIAAGGANLS